MVSRGEPCHQHHYDNRAIFPPMIVAAVQLVAAGMRSDTLRRPGGLSAPGSQAGCHMRLVTSREDSFPQICPELVQAETVSGTCLESELMVLLIMAEYVPFPVAIDVLLKRRK